ncbi:MAG: hypothetical protein JWQ75_254 [Pseudarthrobacter sp.]|nr:hypothetical protein [Pseudarthrobacter sp.]
MIMMAGVVLILTGAQFRLDPVAIGGFVVMVPESASPTGRHS